MVRSTISTTMLKAGEDKERALELECETKINIKSEPGEDATNLDGVFDTNQATMRSAVSTIKIKKEREDEKCGLDSKCDTKMNIELALDIASASIQSHEIKVDIPTRLDINVKCEPVEYSEDSVSCWTDNFKTDSVDIKTKTDKNISITVNKVLVKSEIDTGMNSLQALGNTNQATSQETSDRVMKTTYQIEIEIERTNEEAESSVLNTNAENSNISSAELARKNQCYVCKKQFKKVNHLTTHLRTHTGERPYECDICKRRFVRKSNLMDHLPTHSGEKPYECEICKRRFVRKSNLNEHKRTHSGEKPFKCEICNKPFKQKAHLTSHLYTHTKETPFECEICKKQFKQKPYLTSHLLTQHYNKKRPFSCEICKKEFKRKPHLTTHLLTHSEKKPYECKICNEQFELNSNIPSQESTHTSEEEPNKCEVRKRQFIRKTHLLRHLRTQHGKTK